MSNVKRRHARCCTSVVCNPGLARLLLCCPAHRLTRTCTAHNLPDHRVRRQAAGHDPMSPPMDEHGLWHQAGAPEAEHDDFGRGD